MRRVAVIHTGALGDFLQTFPALAAIRETWPGAGVTLVGRSEWMPLAASGGLVDRCVDADTCGLHRLMAPGAGPEALPAALADAECVLSFLPHDGLRAALRRATGARVVDVVSFPRDGECNQPAAQFVYDQVATAMGLPPREAVPQLRVTAAASGAKPDDRTSRDTAHPQTSLWVAHDAGLRTADDTGSRMADDAGSGMAHDAALDSSRDIAAAAGAVVLAPGSGSRRKNWPLERFEELAAQLSADGLPTVWLLGPAEGEREDVRRLTGPRIEGATILAVAVALSQARCLVGNDSGTTHLAAALGRPTVALFGPSDAMVWSPRGRHVRVITAVSTEMSAIDVSEVRQAVADLLTGEAT